jgi:hypothetical protein
MTDPEDRAGTRQPTEPADTGDEMEHSTGQVLGQSVPVSRDVTRAEPGSPETGAVRDAEGRPSAEKPYT